MKKLLTLLLMCPALLFAQNYEYKTEVVPVEGMNAVDIYLKAKEWYATAFNSAQDVIQMDERGETLIAKGLSKVEYTTSVGKKDYIVPMNVYFTLTTRFKDGRYKYEMAITAVSDEMGQRKVGYQQYIDYQTEEGVKKLFAETGMSASKKQIQSSIDSSTKFCSSVSSKMDGLIASLKEYVNNTSSQGEDW